MSNLTDLLPAGGGGKNVDFVATGTLASGQTVALKTDGTVETISSTTQEFGTTVTFENANTRFIGAAYDTNQQKIVIAYQDRESSLDRGTAIVGTVSGTSITFGTPVIFNTGAISDNIVCVYDSDQQKIVIAFSDNPNSGNGTAIVGTVSGTSISFGSEVVFQSGLARHMSMVYDADQQKIVIAYSNQPNSDYGTSIVGTVSGTSISFGTAVIYNSGFTYSSSATYNPVSQKTIIAYRDYSNSNYGTAIIGTVSGTSISFGSEVVFNTGVTDNINIVSNTDTGACVVSYRDGNNSNYGTARVGTVSGTSISFGTATVFYSNQVSYNNASYSPIAKQIILATTDSGTGTDKGYVVIGTISGTTISFGSPISTGVSSVVEMQNTYIAGGATALISMGGTSAGKTKIFQIASTNFTSFIGIADAAISSGASGSVTIKGGVATNADISTPAVTTSGSKVVFDDGGPTPGIALAYDPDTAKVVNAFCTTNVQGIVGTVSGTSISYGSASSANGNSSSEIRMVYDTANNKIVAVYKEGFSDARVVIGTVSGTAISWGTPVVFASINASTPNVAYDTNAGKVLIVYKDQADNNKGKAVVGTVSGTSISIGSPVTFMNNNANKIEIVYDANAQKSVLVVQDASSNIGVAYVATISGTSVSFGSPTNFLSSALTANALAITYNSTDNKVIVGYSKGSDNKGYLTTGTVSGTSISFAGETEFSGSTTTNYISLSYKASGNVLGMAYNIGGATTVKFNAAVISGTSFSFGTEQELTAGATDITATTVDLASGNFVASYGDGSNNYDGTTNVLSVSTSMVVGSTYYVQDDGTLGTTSSSVTAGKALSATSINLEYNS